MNAYFNRNPTPKELMYYHGMKEIAFIREACTVLKRIPQEVINNTVVHIEPFKKLFQENVNGTLGSVGYANQLKIAVSMLQEAINNYF
ncbi:MAG TPA: hypothetical protein VHX42_01890 [Candidatus Babeliales bacterium]|nr:hypothetical protein [Candidatus Babeliales bacterium]